MNGTSSKIKGKLKKIEGDLTGDRVRSAQGSAEQAKGNVDGAVSRVRAKAKAKIAEMKARIGADKPRKR